MNKEYKFINKQYEFAAHLRDPGKNPAPPEIEDRRMEIYRGLFYRNLEDFVANGFPVIRKLYSDQDWHRMIRHFMSHHQSSSPYFMEISQEFLKYLQDEHEPQNCDPPFLLELAHYEWVEMALSVSDTEIEMQNIDANASLLAGHPVISPLACLLNYQWPVHKLGPDYQPATPPEHRTHIVVYRDRSDKVRFVTVNPVSARLIEILQSDTNISGQAALENIAREMQHPKPDIVVQGGAQTMEQLKSQGIILGVAK